MKQSLLALALLVIASLACGTYVPTVTPTAPAVTDTAISIITSTHSPTVTATASETAQAQMATVKQPVVNVRDAKGGKPTGKYITAGQSVKIVEISGDWVHIADPDGWIFIGCLDGLSEKGCQAE